MATGLSKDNVKLNRKQRRAIQFKNMREQQLKNLRESSLPTHQPIIDLALLQLASAVSALTSLKWTQEEIYEKIRVYLGLEKLAHDELKELGESPENSDPEIYQTTLNTRLKMLRLERYEHDLEDPAVKKALDFLHNTEEGKNLVKSWGY
jgi:hypothetical protein